MQKYFGFSIHFLSKFLLDNPDSIANCSNFIRVIIINTDTVNISHLMITSTNRAEFTF